MIERFMKNELSLKRWRRFRSHTSAMVSIWVLLLFGLLSFTAEIWANNKPIYLKHHGQSYWPVFQKVHPSEFGITTMMVMDYKTLELGPDDYAIWPLIRWDAYQRNPALYDLPSGPSKANIFGVDESGRDVAARLLYGFRYSMTYAVAVWFFCSLLGVSLGAMMGFFAGWIDIVGQRVIEVWESVPTLMLLIILASIISPTIWILTGFTVFFGWTGISLYLRAEFLKLRKREFVEAARALGSSRRRIIFRHILPNSLTPWITWTPFMVAGAITGLASLDYLGYGLPAPTPSWGELLGQAQKHFQVAWWLAVFPSLALFATLTALNLIGSAVRDAYDPRK
ncbi:MAG: ABC transporter permease subunit [Bdellovibrionales bacterium]|jgi:microcin C transport system permease protein|nr:ABC transporter permease subunit [Bdellovibrionales bacterium]